MKVYVVSAHFFGQEAHFFGDTRKDLGVGKSRHWAGNLLKRYLDDRHEVTFGDSEYFSARENDALNELNEIKESIDAWVADPDETDYDIRCSDAQYSIEYKELA